MSTEQTARDLRAWMDIFEQVTGKPVHTVIAPADIAADVRDVIVEKGRDVTVATWSQLEGEAGCDD